MNMNDWAQRLDADYIFPRPANEQFLSSYKAFLRLVKDGGRIGVAFGLSLATFVICIYTWHYALKTFNLVSFQGPGALVSIFLLIFIFLIVALFTADVSGVLLPYRLEFQRETHGSSTWARLADLRKEDVDAVRKNEEDIRGKGVILAPFGKKNSIFVSLKRMAQSLIVFGPPGSGKSSTFFMPVIRWFSWCGGAVILDVKGELFNYTAHSFGNVYRLDIQNPLFSDWLNLFGGCYRNPDLARRIASYMVGYDANKHSAKEPIWDQSAVSMLAVLIMYLCEKKEHPTPRDIIRFMAENPKFATRYNPEKGKDEYYSPINEAFEACGYTLVREIWLANFAGMPKDTYGSVKFNVDTAIQQMISPKVSEILRPPTEEERKKGRREIKWTDARKMFRNPETGELKGTAIYVVVSPSQAVTMDVFLRVVFSVALDNLREHADEGSAVMIALDEAGNVPLAKLPEGINTDRSKRISYFLGYQSVRQPVAQYGRDSAETFLESAGVNIFMPGIEGETADLATRRLGETTILQRSSSDATNDGFDHEKTSEAGRKLMYPTELTTMRWFTTCVITIKGALPIKTRVPEDAKVQDIRVSEPRRIVINASEEVFRELGMWTEDRDRAARRLLEGDSEQGRSYVVDRNSVMVAARDLADVDEVELELGDVENEVLKAPVDEGGAVTFSDEVDDDEERSPDEEEAAEYVVAESHDERPERRRI